MDILKHYSIRNFGVNPDLDCFVDISDYMQTPLEGSSKSVKKLENFFRERCAQRIDFRPTIYRVLNRDEELAGIISTLDSVVSIVYKGVTVGAIQQVEVYNQFKDAVSAKNFLQDPKSWHKRLQTAFFVFSGDSFNGEEFYRGIYSAFLEQDVLLDVVSDKILF